MSMFETFGKATDTSGRKENTLRKLERLNKALRHQEPDRVPISDFFWGGFTRRWRKELGLPDDANPYFHYDLDLIVTVPNMDPWIRPFETLKEDAEEVVVKTGFGAIMHKHFEFPMPEMRAWEIDSFEKLERAKFDDPRDRRRFFAGGDNQIAGVGDGFERNSPAWLDTVKSLRPDLPSLRQHDRGERMPHAAHRPAERDALDGRTSGTHGRGHQPHRSALSRMCPGRDGRGRGIARRFCHLGRRGLQKGNVFSPRYWREYFKPWVAQMAKEAHTRGLPVIYHGCGNVKSIFEDYIEMGIDAYNPLEVKAGMDCVELRRQYGHRIGFCGNSDMQVWESGDRDAIRREVLRKLNAAKGGGYIFMSDHSVSSGVSGQTYDYIVKLVREFGTYPIRLPAGFEEAI